MHSCISPFPSSVFIGREKAQELALILDYSTLKKTSFETKHHYLKCEMCRCLTNKNMILLFCWRLWSAVRCLGEVWRQPRLQSYFWA